MSFFITVVIFLIIINFLVFFHELGHFVGAKLTGVGVNEFALGFGKKLFSRKFKGTEYVLRLIPMGGYVQLEGEHNSDGPNSFRNKPYFSKLVVLLGGVFMNVVIAVIFLGIFLALSNYNFLIPKYDGDFDFTNVKSQDVFFPVTISKVAEDSELTGELSEGDTIVEVNSLVISDIDDFYSKLDENAGKNITLTLIDLDTFEKKIVELNLNLKNKDGFFPVEIYEFLEGSPIKDSFFVGEKIIGFNDIYFKSSQEFFSSLPSLQEKENRIHYIDTNGEIGTRLVFIPERVDQPVLGIRPVMYDGGLSFSFDNETGRSTYFVDYEDNLVSSFSLTYDLFRYQFTVLSEIITNAFENGEYEELSKSVSGPVAIGSQIGQAVEYEAFIYLIPLTALISLSLATFNVLPFPALDGGQVVVATLESLFRRRLPDGILNIINVSGFVFLIVLAVGINLKDLILFGWVEELWDQILIILGK